MTHTRLLAYAQLVRLPNVFTAFADIGLAGCAVGSITGAPGVFVLVLFASGALYLSGMVWNDYFDRHRDAETQPFRPIPSGRVSPRTALILALGLMLTGGSLATLTWYGADYPDLLTAPPGVAALLMMMILLYDGILKHTPIGPVAMGACRFLNVLFGVSAIPHAIPPALAYHLACVIGFYIVGVTWFARTEESTSQRRQLVLASIVMLVAVLAGIAIPVHFTDRSAPWYFPYFITAFLFLVGIPIVRAIQTPGPTQVQRAVKRSILGLIVLDAILSTAFVGLPGLLILLLLAPAWLIGKWVYST